MKKQMKKYQYLLLIPVIYGSLALNFFVAKETQWSMHIKAWFLYATFIILLKVSIILTITVIYKKITGHSQKYTSSLLFIIGGLYFIFPIHIDIWLYESLFTAVVMITGNYIMLKRQREREQPHLMDKKYYTYLKKSSGQERKELLQIIMIALCYTIPNSILLYCLLRYWYNPYIKSLEYLFGSGYKITIG